MYFYVDRMKIAESPLSGEKKTLFKNVYVAIKLVAGKLGCKILEGDKRSANKHVNR